MSTRAAARTSHSPATTTLWTGLLTSVLTVVAAVVDQAAVGSIHGRLADVYAGYDVAWQGAESWLVTWLVALGVLGAAGWVVTARGAARGRGWTAPAATVLFALGLVAATVTLSAAEYGSTLFPVWIGLLGLLPVVVGAVAVVQLWRARR